MKNNLNNVKFIELNHDFADNGKLSVIESKVCIPFSIARVFNVRGNSDSTRGNHAHKKCTQFLTCPYGKIEVFCDDGFEKTIFVLDRIDFGLLIPPGIWTNQRYIINHSVLTVVCDRPYESGDYIRNYKEYLRYYNIG